MQPVVHLRVGLAVFIASFVYLQADASFPSSDQHNGNILVDTMQGSGNNKKCSWNCTIAKPELPDQLRTSLGEKIKNVITFVLDYEKIVDKKCANQTSNESNGDATTYFQIWEGLPSKGNISNADIGMQSLFELIFFLP